MKIRITKENEEIVTKFENDDMSISDFDYVILIKQLFCGQIPELKFSEDIEEEDKTKIQEMYFKICEQAKLSTEISNNETIQ